VGKKLGSSGYEQGIFLAFPAGYTQGKPLITDIMSGLLSIETY